MKQFLSNVVKSKWVLSSVLPLILLFSLFHITGSKVADVQYHPAYKQFPAEYVVEASPSKKWHDSHNTVLVVLSFFVAAILPFVYIGYVQSKANEGNIGIIGLIWLVALILFFAQYATKSSSSSYTSTISEQEFEANKGDLNALFPRIDK